MRRGFSLIELFVVLTIVCVLIGILFASRSSRPRAGAADVVQ